MEPMPLMDILQASLVPALLIVAVIIAAVGLFTWLAYKLGTVQIQRQYQQGFRTGLTGESCDSTNWYYVDGFKAGRDFKLLGEPEKTDGL